MEYKLLHENSGQRTFVVVLSTGEEVFSSLNDFLKRENVHAAQLTAIGALSELVLMYFDWEKKEYQKRPVKEQVEVASLIGDVAEGPDGAPTLHIHIVVGTRDGSAKAGHLGEARVRPTLEVIVTGESCAFAQGQGRRDRPRPDQARGLTIASQGECDERKASSRKEKAGRLQTRRARPDSARE